jgi:branched-chain amino acid transport system permease protein
MDSTIALMLAQDGLTIGAIYVLLALGLVLVFSITRVIFIPLGELLAFAALSLMALQAGRLPQVIWLVLGLGALCAVLDGAAWLRRRSAVRLARSALGYVAYPGALWAVLAASEGHLLPAAAQVLLTLALFLPLGAMLYRVAYQPVAEASVLVLLIISVGVHFVLLGVGLILFGAEGSRAEALWDARFNLGELLVSGQSLLVVLSSALTIAVLYTFFRRTLAGKALLAAAVCRRGAQLVGIGTEAAGLAAFTLAALIAALCGVLTAPLTTIYFDSGFLLGLKGFVGAIFGGLASYPGAALGALFVGMLESYASFQASAYKEVIVFSAIVPVLLWLSLSDRHGGDEA